MVVVSLTLFLLTLKIRLIMTIVSSLLLLERMNGRRSFLLFALMNILSLVSLLTSLPLLLPLILIERSDFMIDLFIPVWLTFIFCIVIFGLTLLNFFKGE